jgi:hypothetical protein
MYIIQQDETTARTSKVTQEYLDEEMPEFIKKTSGHRSRPIAIQLIIVCIFCLGIKFPQLFAMFQILFLLLSCINAAFVTSMSARG